MQELAEAYEKLEQQSHELYDMIQENEKRTDEKFNTLKADIQTGFENVDEQISQHDRDIYQVRQLTKGEIQHTPNQEDGQDDGTTSKDNLPVSDQQNFFK